MKGPAYGQQQYLPGQLLTSPLPSGTSLPTSGFGQVFRLYTLTQLFLKETAGSPLSSCWGARYERPWKGLPVARGLA